MTVPLLGTLSVSGFANAWFLLVLIAIAVMTAIYVVALRARRRRVLRFANLELLQSIARPVRRRWRHLPAALLVASLALTETSPRAEW